MAVGDNWIEFVRAYIICFDYGEGSNFTLLESGANVVCASTHHRKGGYGWRNCRCRISTRRSFAKSRSIFSGIVEVAIR